jgi:hypothetical protein
MKSLHRIGFHFFHRSRATTNSSSNVFSVSYARRKTAQKSATMCLFPPRWWLHLIVVRKFEYVSDPESYTSGSAATGRASFADRSKGRRQTKRDTKTDGLEDGT